MATSRDTIKLSRTTLACCGFLVVTIVLYLYFLNMSVVQVVMRSEHTERQNDLNTEIAMLEASYIRSQHVITSRIATLEGYKKDTEKIFINRQPSSFVLVGQ